MSEVKIATRESYGKALTELGKVNPDVIVFDADLAGATKTGIFKKEFPDRHFDCGIAEANMVGVAAGMSTTGKYLLSHLLQCFWPAVLMNRSETPSATHT